MKTRFLSMLLALVMVGSLAAGCAPKTTNEDTSNETATTENQTSTEKETSTEKSEPTATKAQPDTLVVGTTDMDGFFINGFTNSTYDVAIKTLIGNYSKYYATYTTDINGDVVLDPITNAKEPEIKQNEDGSKTYKFFLNDNLVWNDGTPITAKDYVYSWLYAASPEWLKAGASTTVGDTVVGYADYHEGKSDSLPGVKYIDDTTFEVTLAKEFVPYFYETLAVASSPMPMHRFSPNLEIGEDGSSLVVKAGYEVTDEVRNDFKGRIDEQITSIKTKLEADLKQIDEDLAAYPDEYTKEDADKDKAAAQAAADEEIKVLEASKASADDPNFAPKSLILQTNMYEVAQVYRYKPDVTCGPYSFVENANKVVTLVLNDKFLGDYRGEKPTIKNIIQKTIATNTDVDLAISGEIDIAVNITDLASVQKIRAAAEEGKLTYNSYPRNGFGQLRFLTDLGATKYKEVRKAVGFLLDRDAFLTEMYGGYGTVVDGYYSENQWMYKEKGEELEGKIEHMTINVERANELLDQTPYVFEKDGTTKWDVKKAKELYDANADAFDYWRYTAEGEKLIINQAGAYPPIVELINKSIPNYGKLAGLQYNAQDVDFPTLLDALKNPDLENPKFTAFTMGVGFDSVYDPFYQFHSSQIGNDNQDRVNDPAIDKITEEMRKLDPSEKEKFAEYWVQFNEWFNDYLPELPLYSNEYYDAYGPFVENVTATPFWQWYNDICAIRLK